LPTVVHHGPEIPAQTDRLVLETAGLSPDLVCSDDETYYEVALSLINDADKRHAVMNGLTRAQIKHNIFHSGTRDTDHVFAEVVWHLYQNFDELSTSDRQIFHYTDILALK